MFDIGAFELVFLALLGIVLFGPEKLPTLARKAGRVVRYLSAIANDAKGQLRAELGPEWDDVSFSDLNPKNFIAKHMLDSGEVAAVRGALTDSKDALAGASSDLSTAMSDISSGVNALDSTSDSTDTAAELVAVGPKFDSEAT
ncbi:MAG TPA: sec-independent translocase [Propionibacteriaceae bacterium]|nr:sec-independent translocase [Propionibacteriaceae bacterium]HQE30779.1 sec-independent translocase [Propionibacteriaceae bacterium]